MRKGIGVFALVVVFMIIVLVFPVSGGAAPAKDKIRVGWVTSISGVNAPGVMDTSGNVYTMWVEEGNAKGGLYLKE